MAGKIVAPASQTINSVTAGLVVVTSTAGFYKGAMGYLYKAGQDGMVVRILEVVSATQLKVRQELDVIGGGVGLNDTTVRPNTNLGFTAPSAYAAGTIHQPEQFVYNPNDKPLD